jgi:carboxypeptidase Taq|tara:strand:- start:32 stop:1504 length:1473 start_codon:yes stop_codon:yes gene_type:complete
MSDLENLLNFDHQTQALNQISGRLGWDQETMMPSGSAEQRGQEMAAIEGVLHARRSNSKIGEWLSNLDISADLAVTAQVREIRRSYERALKVPADLAEAIAQKTSVAQGKWASARAADDFAAFAPVLEEVLKLKREEGLALASGADVYDAMLQDYEPGISSADLDNMFGAMRPGLIDLRAKILEKEPVNSLKGTFDDATQMRLARLLAQTFGYDLSKGRIDKAVHPFSSGSGRDVRITTRTDLDDPFNCIYSTIHEVGHGAYEQNVNPEFTLTSIGQGASMGVHESQSRIYENQMGRGQAFTAWLFDQMTAHFGDMGISNSYEFYKSVNRVNRGFIRTEADEVQYNLHILLRFDLERAMISGDLQVKDLEAAWNDRFLADFGYGVERASQGCLQDVHWSVGLFGYFPTYSLGNVYAGCLNQTLRLDVPDLDEHLRVGQTVPATRWLKENLQQYGLLKTPSETITDACRFEPSEAPLLNYLNTKFTKIYNL